MKWYHARIWSSRRFHIALTVRKGKCSETWLTFYLLHLKMKNMPKNCFNFRNRLIEGSIGIVFKILPDFNQNLKKLWKNFEKSGTKFNRNERIVQKHFRSRVQKANWGSLWIEHSFWTLLSHCGYKTEASTFALPASSDATLGESHEVTSPSCILTFTQPKRWLEMVCVILISCMISITSLASSLSFFLYSVCRVLSPSYQIHQLNVLLRYLEYYWIQDMHCWILLSHLHTIL